MDAFVLIQTDHRGGPLAERLLTVPGVATAEDLAGAFDAIVLARAPSARALLDDVIEAIRTVPGVVRALPAPILHAPAGAGDLDPAGDRAA